MSFTCQQCRKTTAQPLNYCPQCGAPTPTLALVSVPQVSQATEFDPFETWDPTKHLGATEALLSASVATLPLQSGKEEGSFSVHPAKIAASMATALTTNRLGLIAVVMVVGLLITAGSSGYAFIKATTITPPVTATPPVAELQTLVATPEPSPRMDNPVAQPENQPSPTITVTRPKPVRRINVESQPNSIVMPSPTPYALTKKTAAPVVPETAAALGKSNTMPTLALIEHGNRLANTGQLRDAIQVYEKARRASPENEDVYYLLGSAYHRSGEITKALEAYRQCTSGVYAAVASNHVKKLAKKHGKTKQDD